MRETAATTLSEGVRDKTRVYPTLPSRRLPSCASVTGNRQSVTAEPCGLRSGSSRKLHADTAESRDQLRAVVHADLLINAPQMVLDGPMSDAQLIANSRIALPLAH